jgi:hypothetical protein
MQKDIEVLKNIDFDRLTTAEEVALCKAIKCMELLLELIHVIPPEYEYQYNKLKELLSDAKGY